MSKLMSWGMIDLIRLFTEHHPAPCGRRCKRSERRIRAHGHLPRTRSAAQLLDAVGVHRAPRAPVAEIAAARAERVPSVHGDVPGVELHPIPALDAVPLVGLEVDVRHDGVAVV